jgi:tetratricopeptide repeat protein/adenylate/guanylate cyclase family protein
MPPPAEQPPVGAPPEQTAAWWLDAVKVEERRGELLSAFDLAERGLAEHPDDLLLKHRAVLALARAGATEEAARRFEQHGLGSVGEEDVAALHARIAKDLALAADGAERRRRAALAAESYAAVFAATGGYYPAINAATLWLVAGDADRARELAAVVLAILAAAGDESYYAAATEAEAHMLRGDEGAARHALERAAARHGGDFGALATTRRQLRTICGLADLDPLLLGILAGPPVVHYCGHRIADDDKPGRFPAGAEATAAARITDVVAEHPPGYAYGSLASGADILWAEALLDRGSELHVVLPFARDEFIETSVAPAGRVWVERFERCLSAATAVSYATEDAYLDDDVLYRYGAELAMGLALLRGRYLEADVRQLALWDGDPPLGAASTAIDVATWRRRGLPATIVTPLGERLVDAPSFPEPSAGSASGRAVCAMLFADVRGFSKLTDEELPRFAEHVLAAFATVLDRHAEHILHRNTWGDALYVVLRDAPCAAACALELQEAMSAIDLAAARLPAHLALRLGGHVGPVFPILDPVLRLRAYMGSHVSRTARIEPVTPAAAVYVTEPFAAALALAGPSEPACDYVGHMAAAKDYGRLRMYRLRR